MNTSNIQTVLVDIDTTITDPKNPNSNGQEIYSLVSIMSHKHGIPVEEARLRINAAHSGVRNMVGRIWPFGVLGELDLSEDEVWQALCKQAKETLFMHADAVAFLKGLREQTTVNVYTATTNPALIILSKLAIGGLADRNGSPYLDDVFGGEEVCLGGKATPAFYQAILERTGSSAESTLMVGDNPHADLALAKQAGIHQVALVRRNQEKDWIQEPDGGLYVKKLTTLLDYITGS